MVLVLKKEVVKTNNNEQEDTGKYRQLLVRTLHQCCVKFSDVAPNIIPVVSLNLFLLTGTLMVFILSLGKVGILESFRCTNAERP